MNSIRGIKRWSVALALSASVLNGPGKTRAKRSWASLIANSPQQEKTQSQITIGAAPPVAGAWLSGLPRPSGRGSEE